jgi:hypothetical protein
MLPRDSGAIDSASPAGTPSAASACATMSGESGRHLMRWHLDTIVGKQSDNCDVVSRYRV